MNPPKIKVTELPGIFSIEEAVAMGFTVQISGPDTSIPYLGERWLTPGPGTQVIRVYPLIEILRMAKGSK